MKSNYLNLNILRNNKIIWGLLIILVTTSLTTVIAPVFIIQPFKPQNNLLLTISYHLRMWSVFITSVALVLALVLQYLLWNKMNFWLGKLLVIFASLPLLASSWFARQNHFEWMFAPLPKTSYQQATDASFIADKDMVLAVTINGEAAAYPVKQLAYHHIVQDKVGDVPIVVTY
jgi:hypothetical protein